MAASPPPLACPAIDRISPAAALLRDPLDWAKLRTDIADLRARIRTEHAATSEWDVKYADGGLLEIDFLLQGLALAFAPQALPCPTIALLVPLVAAQRLAKHQGLGQDQAQLLQSSYDLQLKVLTLLRLCQPDARQIPSESVRRLAAEILGLPSGTSLATLLKDSAAQSHAMIMGSLGRGV